MTNALECDHCGGDAIVSTTGYFSDGEGTACATCGWPGHVSVDGVDDDPDENFPHFVLDNDGACKDPTCIECNEVAALRLRVSVLEASLADADDWIVSRTPYTETLNRWVDHACAQCVPGGPIVRPDFTCVYHAAKARIEARVTVSPKESKT